MVNYAACLEAQAAKLSIESFNDPLMAALIPLGNAGVNCKAAIKWEN